MMVLVLLIFIYLRKRKQQDLSVAHMNGTNIYERKQDHAQAFLYSHSFTENGFD